MAVREGPSNSWLPMTPVRNPLANPTFDAGIAGWDAGAMVGEYFAYAAQSSEPADQFFHACTHLAADTLERHRPAWLALVDALLGRRTLERAEILVLWQRHAETA